MRVFPASVIDRDGLHKCNLRGLREALWACQPADVCLVDGFKLGPTCAAAPGDRRRRHEERRDRRGVDRRQGDARPLHAHRRRAVSRLRVRVARRLHHAVAHRDRARARALRDPPQVVACARLPPRSLGTRRSAARRAGIACAATASSTRTAGCAGAELDVVARRGRVVVFCEVKSKSGDGFGDPLEMVDARKAAPRAAGGGGLARRPPAAGRARRALRRDRRARGAARAPGGRVLGAAGGDGELCFVGITQEQIYEGLDLDLSWSERELPERERTKHVHRLHPYLGKYVPQLVEELFRRHVPARGRVLDPFAGSGTTLVQALESGLRLGRRRHRRVQLPADARQDRRRTTRSGSSTTSATRSRGSSVGRATRTGATPYVRRWFAPRARATSCCASARSPASTSTQTCCASCSRARHARRGARPTSTSTSRRRRSSSRTGATSIVASAARSTTPSTSSAATRSTRWPG